MKHSPEVQARLLTMNDHALANLAKMEPTFHVYADKFSKQINRIMTWNGTKRQKIYLLWEAYDILGNQYNKVAACKLGCNHCCHIATSLTQDEAEAIGHKIGVKPKHPPKVANFHGFDFGYHNPCVFLHKDVCSIYAYRPMACRTCYNMDDDELLCRFDAKDDDPANLDGTRPVPYLNQTQIHQVTLQILQPAQMECLADIRDYFPRGIK